MAVDFSGLNASVIAEFGSSARYQSSAYGESTATLIIEDPTTDMEVPNGALKVAYGSVAASGLDAIPQEEDHIWIDTLCYRVFDVKIDAGGMFQLALTQ